MNRRWRSCGIRYDPSLCIEASWLLSRPPLLHSPARSPVNSSSFFAIAFLSLASSLFAQFQPPAAYYDQAIGKTGAPLKAALHAAIKVHTVLPYTSTSTDTWDALKVIDEDPLSSNNVVLIYSGFTDLKVNQDNGTTGTWNREHLWPQSYGLVALDANSRAKTDIFNLRPIDASVNSSRGNKIFDWSIAPVSIHPEAPMSTYDSDSWEPRDTDKGLIARSMFYMAVRYEGTDADAPDLELSDSPNPALYRFGKLSTFLAWNRDFPVTDAERQRNQRIYTDYQHNRNPFIDHPDYADMVFNGTSPAQAWKNIRFSSIELGNPLQSGDLADPDGDQQVNLLEYTFNRNPKKVDTSPAVTSSFASNYVYLSFPKNRNATDVVISCESSGNLQSWAPAASEIVSSTVTDFETEQVTLRVPTSTAPFFVRLKVVR